MYYLYKDLTYKIIGFIYEMYNELGQGYQEKIYQKAFEVILKENDINYKKELYFPIIYKNKLIGKYFADFVIEDKLLIEFKVGSKISNKHISQVLGYIKSKKIDLALIILFSNRVEIKRIIN